MEQEDLIMAISIFDDTMVNMTWPEVDQAAKDNSIVLLPLAVIEAHGPHLSLGTDTYSAHTICCLVKQKLSYRGVKAVVAPPFYWGVNKATGEFPGSFTSRESTVRACLYDICDSLYNFGFRKVYGINIHGDPLQMRSMIEGCKEAVEGTGIEAKYVIDKWKVGYLNEQLEGMNLTGSEPYCLLIEPETPVDYGEHTGNELHAGANETAQMLAFHPETVRLDIAKQQPVVIPEHDDIIKWIAGEGSRAMTPRCYIGAPAEYDRVDGMARYTNFAELVVAGIMDDIK